MLVHPQKERHRCSFKKFKKKTKAPNLKQKTANKNFEIDPDVYNDFTKRITMLY